MADVREYIKINPIDQDLDKAIGVRFPFNADGVFYSTYTTSEQVKSNLLNVILTEPGERVFKPNFGVGLRKFLFESFTDVNTLEGKIRNQVERFIPQIELDKVTVDKAPDSHELNVSVFYRVKSNNEIDAIQVSFAQDSDINESSLSSPDVGSISTGGSGGY